MSVCNRFHERLANNGKITTFTGVPLFHVLQGAQDFLILENQDHRNLRLMLKISYVAYPCLSLLISAQFALEMCFAARNSQKIHKTPFWRSRSFKVIKFQKASVRLSILLGPISHRYWDRTTYWQKLQIFPTSLLFNAFGMTPFEFMEIFTVPKTRVFQPTVRIWWS